MTHAIHPKISEAVVSLALAIFAFFALLVLSDAFKAPVWFDRQYSGFAGIDYLVQTPLEVFVFVVLFALPLALWHAVDALSHDEGVNSRAAKVFGFYPPVLFLFIVGMIGVGMGTSGFAGWLSCYRPEPVITTENGNEFGFWCTPDPTYLAIFLIIPALFSLVGLTLAKTGYLIVSKFR